MYDEKLLQTIIIDIVVVSNFEGAIAIRKYSPYRKVYIVPEVFRDKTFAKDSSCNTCDAEFSGVADPCIIENTISISCQDPWILRSLRYLIVKQRLENNGL